MRRFCVVLLMVCGIFVACIAPANADKVTVTSNGSPDLAKMVVNNGASTIVVKLHGVGGKDKVRWSLVRLKGTDGVTYEAKVGWYPGGVWVKSLYRGDTEVSCHNYAYAWEATGDFWRVSVPRSCVGKLTNRVKAYSEHVGPSATPGEAGWSPWIARG